MDAWLPQSILALRGYSRRDLWADLLAGITVGLVALPLAMAFAIASGLPPQAGLITAVVAGFLISALGGSRTQIGGPTGAFVVVIAGIVARFGVDGLFTCTLMAGVLLVLLGATGLGTAVRFIPRPVVIGFTNGIAVLIASTQIKDFFGLTIPHPSSVFVPRLIEIAHALPTWSRPTTLLGVGALAVVLLAPRIFPRVPGSIVALVLGTAAAMLLPGAGFETIGTRFGTLPAGLTAFRVPHVRPELVHELLAPSLTVAMLGAIESLLSATVADRMTKDRHNPNVELVAQGIANIASPMFGGLPATGAIARTATSIRSGARTPVAGMVHALTLLAVLMFAAPLTQHVPIAVLSAILLVVSWNMGEWQEIPELLKLSKADISVWLVTFMLTVFADLTLAVEAGMILAALLFIRKVAATTTISEITHEEIAGGRVHVMQDKHIPGYVTVFRIHGPFLFGSTDKLDEVARRVDRLTPIVVLRLRNMTAIDATGLQAIEDLADRLHAAGRTLILCGARQQPAQLMARAEFDQHVGHENICPNIQAALARASELYDAGPARAAAN
ncbi:MAG TPA: SulP family inorganic anion transporter [Candidatus Eisenbacteria bacterium]|nr:SulP family inorganic anion transporter [Candidatus Eisenbacteria bacterium]